MDRNGDWKLPQFLKILEKFSLSPCRRMAVNSGKQYSHYFHWDKDE